MEDVEEAWYRKALTVQLALAALVFAAALRITAPYGRHAPSSSLSWTMPAREGWILMESPSLWFSWLVFSRGRNAGGRPQRVMMHLFQAHYTHRVLVYPFRMRSAGRTIPLHIVALSFAFNCFNAYAQARWLSHFGNYADDWLRRPQFLAGLAVFATGMFTNIWSDSVLISLRSCSGGDGGYKLPPRRGLFKLVLSPNYGGEILEWLGWAILTWSPPGFAFFTFTFSNLVPRALAHRRWYAAKFPGEFDPSVKAVIPFLL